MLKDSALPNMVQLQQACRRARHRSDLHLIESMTADGRDRSLDYKITGFNVPKGSPDAKMVDELAPTDDEIMFPKTSSSVFISTNIDYVLRNLGTRYPDHRRLLNRPVRRLGDPRRLRSRIPGDGADRCLRDPVGGTA